MSATHASLTAGPSLGAMARIETIRLAKNPFFIVATLATIGFAIQFMFNSTHDTPGDLLSWPVIPAFFVGLTSLVVMARQTKSTEAAAEAMNAAPGTEARRTQALIAACVLPAVIGLAVILFEVIGMAVIKDPAPQEWWFGTVNDLQVWAMLLANGPVACFGGGVLGVLIGRHLHFPGAPAVAVIALVVSDMLVSGVSDSAGVPVLRLWSPWAGWQSGTQSDGTADLGAGNAAFYLVYVVCLCVGAAIFAIRHDKTARTPKLKQGFAAILVVGLVALGLSMVTGDSDNKTSDPVPWQVDK